MKRIFVLALVACLLCMALVSCQGNEPAESSEIEMSQTETTGGTDMEDVTTTTVSEEISSDGESTTASAIGTTNNHQTTWMQATYTKAPTTSTTKKATTSTGKAMTYTTSTSPNGVTVRAPKDENLKVIDATVFGMSTASKDNSDAFTLALAYASEFPNSKIVIPKGVYQFNPSRTMTMKGATNVVIDGQGSEFIFRNQYLFYFSDCETVEVRNLVIDWDWDYYRPANLMKVINKTGSYIDFELPQVDTIDVSTIEFYTMNQYDPETLTPGVAGGREFHGPLSLSKIESLGGNKIRVHGLAGMGSMNVGEVYLTRNYACKAHCFETSNSQNFTYRNITIYSGPGMGFVFSNGSGHMMLKDCTIGLRPGEEYKRLLSTQADCVHALNTSGHLWIEGCDFSFSGDDGTNIHDNVAQVEKRINDSLLRITNTMPFAEGDTLAFLKSDYQPLNVTATITNKAGTQVLLDKELPASVQENCIVVNTRYDSSKYYIANNYYHEGRARGILAQSSDGLIINNRFYRNQGASILIVTDISTGLWSEGTGVENLTIKNNTFERCNVGNWTALIEIHANINGTVSTYPLMKNIAIEGNTFIDFPSKLLNITSADKITVKNNMVKNPTALANDNGNRGEISCHNASNITISGNTYYASPYMNKDYLVFEDSAFKVTNLKVEDNTWKEN